jgi:hypothetical protein
MKLYTDTHRLAVWVIIVVIAASSINLIAESREVLLLYTSIRDLQFTLSNMLFQRNTTGAVILAELRADNPVDYGGLKATQVSFSAYFSSDSSSVFEANPLVWGSIISSTLPPHNSATWNFTVQLNPQNATALSSFYNAHNQDVTAKASFRVIVTTTFLNAFAGTVFYQEQQNLTLTSDHTGQVIGSM